MVILFEARGLVFLGENILPHEISKRFMCVSTNRPTNIELLERIDRMYENVNFIDVVSYEVIALDILDVTDITIYQAD